MSVKEYTATLFGAIFGMLLLASTFAAGEARAQGTVVYEMDAASYGGEFVVPLNKSKVLRVGTPFSELRVGNPEIADVLPLTNQNVYVLGKAPGSTSLSILGPSKTPIAIVDLMVSYDVEGLKRRLFDLMPSETIEVRGANDALVLSGTVSGAGAASTASTIAERFAPGKVSNLLQVKGSQQVMLSVRFAEMKRSVAKDLGINGNLTIAGNDATVAIETFGGVFNPFATAGVTGISFGDVSMDMFLDALEDKRLLKTLAEPNLIALSGETANFLAGGEFPIPIVDDEGKLKIEFKQFGVGLSFTPTVLGRDLINLVVEPEVSAIDRTVAVPTGFDIEVPGISTSRASTTVELRDGQSFAIAGLLRDDFEDAIQQFPFLGDLPIIGALFRSTGYVKGETELVIVVTPHLVKPAAGPDELALPTDNFVPPHELNLFLNGQLEAWNSGKPKSPEGKDGAVVSSAGEAGGLDGSYGHIIQ